MRLEPFDPTRWKIRARLVTRYRDFVGVAGDAGGALSALFGVVTVAALWSLFTEHPVYALAATAVLAYYGFRTYEVVQAYWRKETADHKLVIWPLIPEVTSVNTENNTCTVVVMYALQNRADFDIVYLDDGEEFFIDGHRPAKRDRPKIPNVLAANSNLRLGSDPIPNVPIGKHSVAAGKLQIRYGKRKTDLNIRWFFDFETAMPQGVSSTPDAGGFNVLRSDTEWLSR